MLEERALRVIRPESFLRELRSLDFWLVVVLTVCPGRTPANPASTRCQWIGETRTSNKEDLSLCPGTLIRSVDEMVRSLSIKCVKINTNLLTAIGGKIKPLLIPSC